MVDARGNHEGTGKLSVVSVDLGLQFEQLAFQVNQGWAGADIGEVKEVNTDSSGVLGDA